MALGADAVPLGLGGFEDEIVEEGVFDGAVGSAPVAEEEEPGFFKFAGEDEGVGAGAVFDGVLGGLGAAFGGSGSGAAGIAFYGLGWLGLELVFGIGGRFEEVEIFCEGKHNF